MSGNEYKYYRYRRIKRNVFVGLLFLLIVILISLFICNSGGVSTGGKNGDSDIPGKSSTGSSERGPGMTPEGGEDSNGSREGSGLRKKTGTGTYGKRKTVRRKNSSVEHPVINKVKKVKSEKNLPPKSPTLEIIGDEGKVLMKKE